MITLGGGRGGAHAPRCSYTYAYWVFEAILCRAPPGVLSTCHYVTSLCTKSSNWADLGTRLIVEGRRYSAPALKRDLDRPRTQFDERRAHDDCPHLVSFPDRIFRARRSAKSSRGTRRVRTQVQLKKIMAQVCKV